MRVLVTGADGFIGKNLLLHLSQRSDVEVVCFTRDNSIEDLPGLLDGIDFIFHLAGINRPDNPEEFITGNSDLTLKLTEAMVAVNCKAPIIYSSSIQAALDNPYGKSKRDAEIALLNFRDQYDIPVTVFRLPNVFGKWAKPNYNSAVATFCYNIANGLPIKINDPDAVINLVYIDDVIGEFLSVMDSDHDAGAYSEISSHYTITVGELADKLYRFHESRDTLTIDAVGSGLTRALYSTYLSYFHKEQFTYEIPKHEDPRGVFVEMLKTSDSGQFSYFSAHPGVTRGGHYHHTKTEKFLVIKGKACFKFKHMHTMESHELITSGDKPEVVETVPGWSHDITNIGDEEMIVMLWANEIFEHERPDTYACPLTSQN